MCASCSVQLWARFGLSMMATRFLTLRVATAGGLDFHDVSRFFFLGDCGLSGCCRMVSSLG